jgi:hypothetical protein
LFVSRYHRTAEADGASRKKNESKLERTGGPT